MKLSAAITNNPVIVGGVLIVGVAAVWLALRGAQGMARDLTGAAINGTAGVVEGVGLGFGIPLTEQTQCEKDLAAGDYWKASFSCPASKFIGGIF